MDEETLTLEEVAKLLQMQPQAVARIKGLDCAPLTGEKN